MDYNDFRKLVIKAKGTHKFKVTNSNGAKEAWRWIKKNKWLNIGCPITELQLGTIVKAINLTLQDQLLSGKDISFPNRMGGLELRKFKTSIKYKSNKIVTNLPVDWKTTLRLWWEDEESHRNKTLIRYENKDEFTIRFMRGSANFENKSFYEFISNRILKKRLKDKVINGEVDAPLLGKRHELY